MQTITNTCDIHNCKNIASHLKVKMQVIFTTEQTEGRCVKPYFSDAIIDLCKEHHDFIIEERKYIRANGAQGYNEYNL